MCVLEAEAEQTSEYGASDYFSRVIVAGGGGGAVDDNGTQGFGGGGNGGTSGGYSSQGGGQTSVSRKPQYGVAGGFGEGGYMQVANGSICGGGGGWYGGDAGQPGSGGSGFVLTETSILPAGYKLGNAYILEDAQTIAGNQSFPAPGGGNEKGHSGNGYARITLIE